MNSRDTELVYGLLLENGYGKADSAENADIILFNTCSVRKHAEDRVYGQALLLRKWKRKNPNAVLGVIGCMAQNHKEKIFDKLPHVDFVCGPANIYEIPELIKKALSRRGHLLALDRRQRPNVGQPACRESDVSASVSISEGCDNFCAYCIVPYVRGREQSRSEKLILDEIKNLADLGYKEVVLLGQNVNSYKSGRVNGFVKLLEDINKIKGIERIRFMTSHPKDASPRLFKAMRDMEKVCEHLHLPLQSGSDRILKRMRRGYGTAKYLKLVESFRKILPGSSITTDIIVGFPGETEKDFDRTYKIIEKVKFDSAFIFKYSPRPPAKASGYPDDVPPDTKAGRNQALLKLQENVSRRINESLVGKNLEVLVEAENSPGKIETLWGRTRTNKVAVFGGELNLLKKLINIRVKSVTPYTLVGEKLS